jgi:hypothetical protein
MYAANPERVVNRIFSNPNYAKVVSEYVGPQKMQELVGSYLQRGVDASFDSAKGFQPHVLKNWLKKNQTFISNYVDPAMGQRINALSDYGYYGRRFLDEVNPSGTAASLKEMIQPKDFIQKVKQDGFSGAVQSEVAQRLGGALKQKQATRVLNEKLGGTNPSVTEYIMQKYKDKVPSFDDALKFQGAGAASRALETESALPRVSEEPDDSAKTFEESSGKDAILQKTQNTKYAQIMQQAAQRGDQAVASNHFILIQKDPEYRKMFYGGDD